MKKPYSTPTLSELDKPTAPAPAPPDPNPYGVSLNHDGHVEVTMHGHCLLSRENALAFAARLTEAANTEPTADES